MAEVDGRRRAQHQRVGAGAAVDRDFGAVIRHGVVAAAGVDDVGAAAAVDGVVAGTGVIVLAAEEPVTVSAVVIDRRVEVLEIGDAGGIAGGLVGARSNREIDAVTPPVAASTSVSMPLPPSIDVSVAVIDHGVVAGAGVDGVGAAGAVDACRCRNRR